MLEIPNIETNIIISDNCWCFGRPKTNKKKEKGMSSTVREQLHVLHDPFSGATSQPKIPDGKVNDSLGFSTQAVREHRNKTDGNGIMHMLLYAGTNGSLLVTGLEDAGSAFRGVDYNILGFADSGGFDFRQLDVDWPPPAGIKAFIYPLENYALHRVVSCGMQLKLLNAQDEDDGWFEAVRVNEVFDTRDYRLDQIDSGITDWETRGTIAPYGVLKSLEARDITNDPTYATGLLRDLGRCQFDLHGRIDYHDFRRCPDSHDMEAADMTYTAPQGFGDFTQANDNAEQIIDRYIDRSYDMVYVRLHCRPNGIGSTSGSRLHTNVVSNQEIYYPPGQRDNRYHTMSPTVGAQTTSLHFQARRANRSAVKLV